MTSGKTAAPIHPELPMISTPESAESAFEFLSRNQENAASANQYLTPVLLSVFAMEKVMYESALARAGLENRLLVEQLKGTRYQLQRTLSQLRLFDPNLGSLMQVNPKVQLLADPALINSAAERYKTGLISLGRAAEIAGVPIDTMIDELQRRGIGLQFGPKSIEEAEADEARLIDNLKRLKRST